MSAAVPIVVKEVDELRRLISTLKSRGRGAASASPRDRLRVGFVPTMGFLHEGHASLVRRARADCDVVVVSIFVNPLQFGAGEDFTTYPRDLDSDLAVLRAERADIVFAPEATEFYPRGADTAVNVGSVAQPLEGAFRPGHFRGVATVVAMLFNTVQAHVAYFGEKDWQQLLVVRHMARDLHIAIDIAGVPTSRDADGLAMSSRNVRLTKAERVTALAIPRALEAARAAFAGGERAPAALERAMTGVLSRESALSVDYAVAVDAETLRPPIADGAMLRALIAARVGSVRLIDNTGF